jgi:hypothetical protein
VAPKTCLRQTTPDEELDAAWEQEWKRTFPRGPGAVRQRPIEHYKYLITACSKTSARGSGRMLAEMPRKSIWPDTGSARP